MKTKGSNNEKMKGTTLSVFIKGIKGERKQMPIISHILLFVVNRKILLKNTYNFIINIALQLAAPSYLAIDS